MSGTGAGLCSPGAARPARRDRTLVAVTGTFPASAARLPGLTVCGDGRTVGPHDVLLGCGDGGQFLSGLGWSSWTRLGARGTGVWWRNLCRPDCASGRFEHPRVQIVLSRPRLCRSPSARLFTRMTLRVTGERPTHVAIPSFGAGRCH